MWLDTTHVYVCIPMQCIFVIYVWSGKKKRNFYSVIVLDQGRLWNFTSPNFDMFSSSVQI